MEDDELKKGDLIAAYRVVRKLGEGGMGAVYEAEQEFTKRRVALKVMHLTRSDRDFKDRTLQEARALAQLDHPNVVRLIDANVTADGRIWLAMEYLDGCTLRDLCARTGPMPLEMALHHLIEACDGVAAGHEIQIIHRDLKPENIFTTRQNVTKVLDFGAAKAPTLGVIRSTAAILASGGQRKVIGTPEYMSPEHLQGHSVDERTDVFALGTIGYEMLAGRHPLKKPGTAPHMWEVVRMQVEEEAPLLTEIAPHVPEHVAVVLQRAMEKNAALRWPRVAGMAAALRAALARYLTERVVNPAYVTPFEKNWVGSGGWTRHGPPISIPIPSPPVDDPSKRVLVQVPPALVPAPVVPALVAPPEAAVARAPTTATTTPSVAVAVATPRPAPEPNQAFVPGAKTVELPATNVTTPVAVVVPVTPSPAVVRPAPAVQHTQIPFTVGPEHRASHPARVRSRRWLAIAFLLTCGLTIAGLAVALGGGESQPVAAAQPTAAEAGAPEAGTPEAGTPEPDRPGAAATAAQLADADVPEPDASPAGDTSPDAGTPGAGAPAAGTRPVAVRSAGPGAVVSPPPHGAPKQPAKAAAPAATAKPFTLPFGPK